jgi:hypothetical protein
VLLLLLLPLLPPRLRLRLRLQAQGAGLDQLGEQQGGVPQVVAEEPAVLVAVRGGQADVERPWEVG